MCYVVQLASTGEVSCFFAFVFFSERLSSSLCFYAFRPFFKARNSELHTTLLDYFSFYGIRSTAPSERQLLRHEVPNKQLLYNHLL